MITIFIVCILNENANFFPTLFGGKHLKNKNLGPSFNPCLLQNSLLCMYVRMYVRTYVLAVINTTVFQGPLQINEVCYGIIKV
jgi:hypothetical protein